jgi:hypothetical protein
MRGWWSSKDLKGKTHTAQYLIGLESEGSVSDRYYVLRLIGILQVKYPIGLVYM